MQSVEMAAVQLIGVSTEGEYRKAVAKTARNRNLTERPQAEPMIAELNCGRWKGQCPCGGGPALHPQWRFGACMACFRTWTDIRFPSPEFLAQIDAVLAVRPTRPQHVIPRPWYSWTPTQTVVDLLRENLRFGWPIPPGLEI